jgi:hypothetical protein
VAIYDAAGKQTQTFFNPHSGPEANQLPVMQTPMTAPSYELRFQRGETSPVRTYDLLMTVPGNYVDGTGRVSAVSFYKDFPFMGNLVFSRNKSLNQGFVLVDATGMIIGGEPKLVGRKIPEQDFRVFRSLREGEVEEIRTETETKFTFPRIPSWLEEMDHRIKKTYAKVPG